MGSSGELGTPHLAVGQRLQDSGDLRGAEAAYRLALATTELEAAWHLGLVLVELGRAAEAIPVLEPGVKDGDQDCLLILGNALSDVGEVDRALEAYEQAVEAGDVGPGWHNYGRLLRKLGRAAEAVEPWRRALAVGHIDAQLFASLLCDAGEFEEAIAVLGVRAEAGDADAWVDIGAIEQDAGRMVEAEEAFRRGLAMDAEDAPVYLANVLKNTGRSAEGRATLEVGAERGISSAELQLANDLARVDVDDPRVEALYRRAMEHGVVLTDLSPAAI